MSSILLLITCPVSDFICHPPKISHHLAQPRILTVYLRGGATEGYGQFFEIGREIRKRKPGYSRRAPYSTLGTFPERWSISTMSATCRFVWRFGSDDEAFKQHGAHQTLASLFSAQRILRGKCSLATGKA
jgi:hypothetical protein